MTYGAFACRSERSEEYRYILMWTKKGFSVSGGDVYALKSYNVSEPRPNITVSEDE